MARYTINNLFMDDFIGVFDAASDEDALDVMAVEMGYTSFRDLTEETDVRAEDLIVDELGSDEELSLRL